MVDELVLALRPVLGPGAARCVTLGGWSLGPDPLPGTVQVRIPLGVERGPDLPARVTAAVTRALGERAEVARNDRLRRLLVLRVVGAKSSLEARRADRIVGNIFGASARIQVLENSAGVCKITIKHEISEKIARPQVRAYIENQITALMPGRWRSHWALTDDVVVFELRPEMKKRIPRTAGPTTGEDRRRIPLAVDEDGHLVHWDMTGTGPHLMVVGKTGTGKLLALDTPVPTPSGWTTMGDLRDGDTVFDLAGQPCTVVQAHDVEVGRPTYEVVFSDGSVIVAGAEHLWWTQTRADRVSRASRKLRSESLASRPGRVTPAQLDELRARRASCEGEVLTAQEISSLLGRDHTHPAVREIIGGLEPVAVREPRTIEFRYREQTVHQRQQAYTYDAVEALGRLVDRARSSRWRHGVGPAELRDFLGQAEPGSRLVASDVAAILGCSTSSAHQLLKSCGLSARRESHVVRVRVPEKVVRRRQAGATAAQFDAAAVLDRALQWASGQVRDRASTPQGAVRTTEEIAATLKTAHGHANHSIPVAGPVQYPTAEQPIPPYALGVWLGDGTSRRSEVTSADPEILDHVQDDGVDVSDRGRPPWTPESYKARSYTLRGIHRHLDTLGLLRGDGPERSDRIKRIPDCYLVASEAQRRLLLAGLLDTDGTVARNGAVQFDNTNRVLAHQVHELACSLGYRAAIREGRARLDGRDLGPKWTVSFTTTDEVFRLERKRLVHKARSARANPDKTRSRYIVDVRPVPSVPMRCITVDSTDRLYLVGRSFIATHNTVLINGVVLDCARRGFQVWICDPKRIEFMGLRGWPNVQLVATSVQEMVASIWHAHQLMEHRYALIEAGADESDFEPLILVLDEYRNFHRQVMAWYRAVKPKNAPAQPGVFDWVAAIAEKGRSGGVHLVLGTQRPDADFMTGSMRDNFDSRCSLGRLSPQGAMMMWESPYLGVSVPRGLRGRGTAVSAGGTPAEVQVMWTPDPRRAARDQNHEDLALLAQLRPAETRHPFLRVSFPEDGLSQWQEVLGSELVEVGENDEPTGPVRGGAASVLGSERSMLVSQVENTDEAVSSDYDDAPSSDEFDGYGPAEMGDVATLSSGDLILLDPTLGQWVTVEAVAEDQDDDVVCISWADDTGASGDLCVDGAEMFDVRRPVEATSTMA